MVYVYTKSDSRRLPLGQGTEKSPMWLTGGADVDVNIHTAWPDPAVMRLDDAGAYSFGCKNLCPSDLGFIPLILFTFLCSIFHSFLEIDAC